MGFKVKETSSYSIYARLGVGHIAIYEENKHKRRYLMENLKS